MVQLQNNKTFSKIVIILLLFTLTFCKKKIDYNQTDSVLDNKIINTECDYSNSLEKFIEIINSNKIDSLSTYIKLPFKKKNVWYLIDLGLENQSRTRDNNDLFDLKEFKKYHEYLYPKELKELLKKVNVGQLVEKRHFQTGDFIKDDETYKLIIDLSKGNQLTMSLHIGFVENEELYETLIFYIYEYQNCNLQLLDIEIAG